MFIKIETYMKKCNIKTKKELADKIGVSTRTVTRINSANEEEIKKIKLGTIIKLCQLFHCSLDELIELEDK